MSHRYPTRFQARNSAKEQVPVQAVKEQAPAQPVNEQAPAQAFAPDLADTCVLSELLHRCSTSTKVERIKIAIDIFAYMSVHTTILYNPRFRKIVVDKIVQLRQEMENKKKEAIDAFVSIYIPDGNNYYEKNTLLNARGVLYYAPLLEVEFKKVESLIH